MPPTPSFWATSQVACSRYSSPVALPAVPTKLAISIGPKATLQTEKRNRTKSGARTQHRRLHIGAFGLQSSKTTPLALRTVHERSQLVLAPGLIEASFEDAHCPHDGRHIVERPQHGSDGAPRLLGFELFLSGDSASNSQIFGI